MCKSRDGKCLESLQNATSNQIKRKLPDFYESDALLMGKDSVTSKNEM